MSLLSENRASLQPAAPVTYVIGRAGTWRPPAIKNALLLLAAVYLVGAAVFGVLLGAALSPVSENSFPGQADPRRRQS